MLPRQPPAAHSTGVLHVLIELAWPLLLGLIAWLGSAQLSDIKQAARDSSVTTAQTQTEISALRSQVAVLQTQMSAYAAADSNERAQVARVMDRVDEVDRRLTRIEERIGMSKR